MESLFKLDPNTDYINTYLIPWGMNIVSAIAVFMIGRILAKVITRAIGNLMIKAKIDETLVNFLRNIIYFALLVVVIIAALDQLGVNTTSVLAVFATAGLAVGLALKDSLSNFAAGVMIIIFRPFKIGDFIEAGGTSGVVEEISIFNTVFRTPDNRQIIVPNAQIYGGTIVNVSAKDTRRIDLVFGIGYDDDLAKARELIWEVIKSDERILKDPEPAVALAELADSSVNIAVRPWVNSGDYWTVRSDMLERVKNAFDQNGISIPYPQRDLHVYHEKGNASL